MNPGRKLYDLQEIDLELGEKAGLLSKLESELNHNQALADAKAIRESRQMQLAELEAQEKQLEWTTDDFISKLEPLRTKLYAGSVQNPKELAGLQHQVEHLKSQLGQEEDKALELMGQVEAVQKEIAAQSAEVRRLEKEWRKKREQLLAEQADLESSIGAVRERRDEMAATVESSHVELYEALRLKKQGYAVAKIEQGRCQGCRITLSMSDMTRIRASGLVQCDSCGRVLCLG